MKNSNYDEELTIKINPNNRTCSHLRELTSSTNKLRKQPHDDQNV